jgi:hypothetical protein
MYVIIDKNGASNFVNLDFTLNFGILMEVRQRLQAMLKEDGETTYETAAAYFATIDVHMLLKLHRYFSWAHKKLHTYLFNENKDKISDDLLIDFKSGPGLVQQKQAKEVHSSRLQVK